MVDDHAFEEFFRALRGEILQQAGGDGAEGIEPDFKENVFTRLVVEEYLAELGLTDNANICHCEVKRPKGSAKVNGCAINDDGDELHLYATLLNDSETPVPVITEKLREVAAQATRLYSYALAGMHREMEAASEDCEMVTQIHDHARDFRRVRVFLLTDGLASAAKLKKVTVGGIPIETEVWDARRLFRSGINGQPRSEIHVDLQTLCGAPVPCLPMTAPARDYQAYLCIFSGPMLHRIYDEYGAALLEYNVRSFLQIKGKVNAGIRRTLLDDPHHFFAFNNGIAATAEEVEVVANEKGIPCIRSMRGFQVVNGAQTTASIHRAVKEDRADLAEVLVPVKITVVQPEALASMVERISLCANSQNAVTTADFSANNPFHIEIERLSTEVWMPGEQGRWFYERARGQYQVARFREGPTPAARKRFEERIPPSRKFTKTDLAKFYNCWERLPHVVGRGAQKNFTAFQTGIERRSSGWKPDADWYRSLIAKAILFKQLERIVRQVGVSAYKANIVAYTIASLSHGVGDRFDLARVWHQQSLSPLLETLLRNWVPTINATFRSTANGRNPSEWAKKEDCWKAIRALDLPLPETDPPELTLSSPGSQKVVAADRPRNEDQEHTRRCQQVAGDAWLRIHTWGKRTGKLAQRDVSIARELATLASEGWKKPPSRQQVSCGVRILDVAAKHGLLEPSVS